MKNIFLLALCLSWITTGRAQTFPWAKTVQADFAEVDPQINWPSPKQQIQGQAPRYMMITGPANGATFGDAGAASSITRVAAGGGNPTPLFGTYSYKIKITNTNGDADEGKRAELYAGSGCDDYTDAQWWMAGIYLPSDWCDDDRPIGMLFDFKHANAQGPASAYMKIEDGMWQWNKQYPQGSNEIRTNIEPITKGVWTYFLVHRNFEADNTGFLELYRWKQGTTATFTLVDAVYGPNYNLGCGANTEGYWVWGIYNWAWLGSEGAGQCNTTRTAYYDNLIVAKSTATLTDFNNFISNGTPSNQSPLINAGVNQTITLPDNDAVMAATTSDPDGVVETMLWTKISGPAGGTISNNAIEDPTMSALQAGTYVFRLTGTDDDGASASDDVTISVLPETPPTPDDPFFTSQGCPTGDCSAVPIPNMTVQLPTDDTTITIYADDPNPGYIQQMLVNQLSGPNSSTIGYIDQNGDNPTYLIFNISGLIAGTYVYQASALDNGDAITVYDTFNVVVVATTNVLPFSYAGENVTLTLDGFGPFTTRSTNLVGTTCDFDGSIASSIWQVVSGPENSVLGSPTSLNTAFSGLTGGTYLVRLTATDNNSAFASDDVIVRVLTCNAGVDQTITSPASTVVLTGIANIVTDTTGVYWSKISGTGGVIVSPTTLTTTITGLTAGTYIYQFGVTHSGGYTTNDRVTITVLAGANVLPSVNAGTDITLALDGFGAPATQSTTLRGTSSDADGTIVTTTWSIVSGPTGSVFGSPSNDTTTFTNLIGGTYIARLTLVDNSGGSSSDDISVRVITVGAGSDQVLVSTTTSITLTATSNSVSDTTDVLWTKISGTGGTITNSGVLSTTVTGLTIGSYVFQVQITHTGGYITKDQVAVSISIAVADNFYQLRRGGSP